MKKLLLIALVVVVGLMVMPSKDTTVAADAGAATVLSLVMPGVGEWYNAGWKGAFPWGECVIGHICFCITLSSAMDAAAGASDQGLRIDFWSSPNGK